ncbi:MAG: hypothetical protein ACR2NR_18830 [Solirubrobacteraceae bacterium]
MTDRWQLWFAAIVVTLLTVVLAILDLVDRPLERWWERHPFTTSVTTGVLVLLITVLVINQVLTKRQRQDRAQAVAAQAAILMGQATRTARTVTEALQGSGDRVLAGDEARTYMTMLLVAAPLLVDGQLSRNFLESAQWLAGVIAHGLGTSARDPETAPASVTRVRNASDQLRAAAQPLISVLNLAERSPPPAAAQRGMKRRSVRPPPVRTRPADGRRQTASGR